MESFPSKIRIIFSPALSAHMSSSHRSSIKAVLGHLLSPMDNRAVCCCAQTVNAPPPPDGVVGLYAVLLLIFCYLFPHQQAMSIFQVLSDCNTYFLLPVLLLWVFCQCSGSPLTNCFLVLGLMCCPQILPRLGSMCDPLQDSLQEDLDPVDQELWLVVDKQTPTFSINIVGLALSYWVFGTIPDGALFGGLSKWFGALVVGLAVLFVILVLSKS